MAKLCWVVFFTLVIVCESKTKGVSNWKKGLDRSDVSGSSGTLLPNCPPGCICIKDKHGQSTVTCEESIDEAGWRTFPVEATKVVLEKLDYLPKAATWGRLSRLTHMEIRRSRVRRLRSSIFNHLSNLRTLILNQVAITEVEVDAFAHLEFLTTLKLGHNQLKIIRADAFSGLSRLEVLELNNNLLTSIEDGAFNGLTSLRSLNLGYNQLTSVPKCFGSLPGLNTLDLSGNPITTFSKGDFEGVENVKWLYMRNMYRLNQFELDAFSGLSSLQSFTLQGCRQLASLPTRLSSETFNDLAYIYLSGNGLTKVSEDTFSNMPSLRKLFLNGNKLHCDCGVAWIKDHVGLIKSKNPWRIVGYPICFTPFPLRGRGITRLSPDQLSCDKSPPDVHVLPPVIPSISRPSRKRTSEIVIIIKAKVNHGTPLISWLLPNHQLLRGNSTIKVHIKANVSSTFKLLDDGSIEAQLHIIADPNVDVTGEYTLVSSNPNGDTAVTYGVDKDPAKKDELSVTPGEPRIFERVDGAPPPQSLDELLDLLKKQNGQSAFVFMTVALAIVGLLAGLGLTYFVLRRYSTQSKPLGTDEKAPLINNGDMVYGSGRGPGSIQHNLI